MTSTSHDIFRHFPFTLPADWKTQKKFLEDTIALKGSRIKSSDHIGGWFAKAGLIDPDHDVNLARQMATFHWLITNIGIYEIKHIPGGCEIGNPTANKTIAKSMAEAFALCASRCGNDILDRERTYMLLILREGNNSYRQILDRIRDAAAIEKSTHSDLIRQNPDFHVDGNSRFNWTNVRSAKTDQALIDLIVKWFGQEDPTVANTVNGLVTWYDDIKPATTKAPNVVTLDKALTAFDLAATPKTQTAQTAQPAKKRSHTKKPDPMGQQKDQANDFQGAVKSLTDHYTGMSRKAGIAPSIIPVTAGPIFYAEGEFRYDTTYETHFGSPCTISLETLNSTQAKCFQKHLEAFDVAFTKHMEQNFRIQAQTDLATGILNFLKSKKAA